jgi:hypothetical protein
MDGIDLGPERRQYLDHQLSRVWECNGQGSIPYVPHLRAPYYVWIGHVPQLATVLSENKVNAQHNEARCQGRERKHGGKSLLAPRWLQPFGRVSSAGPALHFHQLGAITAIRALTCATCPAASQVEAPPMFPPTFLYTQSWEDPRPDMQVLHCPSCSPLPSIIC